MRKKNKTFIISLILCFCLCLMVAYAAFQTNIIIQGTSNISSEWDVEISGVITQHVEGTAQNDGEPVFSPTAVTFKTLLQRPGDSITYTVTVTNYGSISARLDNIEQSQNNNPAINYIIDDINVDDVLDPQGSQDFTVTVEYDENITTQPTNLTSSLTVSLDYVQNT